MICPNHVCIRSGQLHTDFPTGCSPIRPARAPLFDQRSHLVSSTWVTPHTPPSVGCREQLHPARLGTVRSYKVTPPTLIAE